MKKFGKCWYSPEISGKVIALVPNGIIGVCLKVLLLSCKTFEFGEPSTARGPESKGDDALLPAEERRRGDAEPGFWCCFEIIGLAWPIFGVGGVPLILKKVFFL